MPASAAEKRQPKPWSVPKAAMPSAISHLPKGGWTTYSAVSSGEAVPAAKASLASSGQFSSYPACRRVKASLT